MGEPKTAQIDVLVPTRDRPVELATTLAGLAAQTDVPFRVVVSDQSDGRRLLGHARRRDADQRTAHARHGRGAAPAPAAAGDRRAARVPAVRATAPAVLFLDDDVWLEPGCSTACTRRCASWAAGSSPPRCRGSRTSTTAARDECAPFEVWDGPVRPERIAKDGPGGRAGRCTTRPTGCTWPSRSGSTAARCRRRTAGWPTRSPGRRAVSCSTAGAGRSGRLRLLADLPADAHGEDVLVQHRVMARRGGAGILPSGAYHQESLTTIPSRGTSAFDALPL